MKNIFPFITLCIALLLTSCGSRETVYEGISFPKTSSPKITFQEDTVPENCSAFAHLLLNTKINSSGQDIAEAILSEAGEKGANLVVIGRTRETDEQLEKNRFDYYGPEYAYNFNKTWLGWKFGFDAWSKAGNLLGLGIESWGKPSVIVNKSLLIQTVFLRCEDKP